MPVILTKEQRKHYKSIQWLFNGPRGQGKTVLLCLVLLEKAADFPGEWIKIIDHHNQHPCTLNHTLHQLMVIVNQNEKLRERFEVNMSRMEFRINHIGWNNDNTRNNKRF